MTPKSPGMKFTPEYLPEDIIFIYVFAYLFGLFVEECCSTDINDDCSCVAVLTKNREIMILN